MISTVHTESVTRTELFENAFQTGGIWKRRLFVFVLKTELFENANPEWRVIVEFLIPPA